MDSLVDAKRKKEAEIDRICSRHYSDFLSSVSEMLKLRGEAGNLAELVTDVHEKFRTTGGDLVAVVNELDSIQAERENARKLLENTLQCKKISALMVKTKEQIEADDHYNAMRTIEAIQLEMKALNVKSMISCLHSWLPIAINKLLYGARTEADSFVEEGRKHVELLGRTILGRQAHLNVGAVATSAAIAGTGTGEGTGPASGPPSGASGRRGSMTSSRSNAGGGEGAKGAGRRSSVARMSGSAGSNYSTSLLHIVNHPKVFNLTSWAKSNEFEHAVPPHFTAALTPEGEELVDVKLCAMAPLHKVLHLYAVLGDLNSYHEHYRALRGDFFRGILDKAERAANENGLTSALARLFDQLVGFFTLECAFRRCVEVAEGAFSYADISGLWDDACAVITKLCGSLAITVTSPDSLIAVKEDVLLLIDVVADEAYGLTPKPLYGAMRGMWEIFRGLQISAAVSSCTDALDMCAYQPYSATTSQQFQTQVKAFQLDVIEPAEEEATTRNNRRKPSALLKDRESKREKSMQIEKAAANLDALEEELTMSLGSSSPAVNARKSLTGADSAPDTGSGRSSGLRGSRTSSMMPSLPSGPTGAGDSNNSPALPPAAGFTTRTYPFSFAVPLLLRELHILVIRFFLFAVKNSELGGRSEDICLAIVSAFEAICKSLKRELNKDGVETPLSKACQIAIDGASLMSASDALWLMVENGLKHFHWTENLERYMTTGIESATSALRHLVLSAQDLIFELLSNKIDGLMESLAFINFVPETLPDGPHESVEAIVEFLKVTLMWLAHLPPSVREAVHFTCCTRVAQGIMTYILSPSVTRINMLCILAFDYDVKLLLHFADSCGVPHLKQCFEELHEMVKCLLHPNLTHYADNLELRVEHFPYTQTEKLIVVLEKVRHTPHSSPCMQFSVHFTANILPTCVQMTPASFIVSSGTSRVPVLDKNALRTLLKKLKTQV
jgi:hypothetical protein